ncbi:CE1759 family FMN reductase [Virgisporangium aurantiacum]|uniref:FMN reductase n=1 Tax=Virgisporangium aurantiacum TaxID=175570 RepID=A0A8J3YXS7_9ACTN|nr:CE1759 family FMN reductase [Virgisporangium aurantiacum]GIJ52593.1 FMN reductase [Virgisporangium aurantiacum]
MTPRTLAVVSAGLSQPSSSRLLAERLAAGVVAASSDAIRALPVIEVRDHSHDVVNNLLTGFPPAALASTLAEIAGADGLIVVTPIFNTSYSGLFKSFFDVFEEGSLRDKPVLLGATGGTARHSLALEYALRPMFTYLRAAPVATSVFAAPEDWASGGADTALAARIERAAHELSAEILRRNPATVHDPFDLTTSFDQLLAGD